MKNRLIAEITRKMLPYLDNAQMEQLQDVLQHCLWGIQVTENPDAAVQQEKESNVDLLNMFLSAKRVEGCSDKTLHYYENSIRRLFAAVDCHVTHMQTDDLRTYLSDYQQQSQCSKSNIDNIRRILSSFFTWLEDENYIIKSPVRRIHKIRSSQTVKETYSDESLETMRDQCGCLRDLAMIDLLASTGMRVGELVRLNVDENDDEFRIAVSVDMLDTGIDVPAVVNLVFFKPVKSKIKFVQMIGRGTRLCENLFGEGKDKTHFIIFDYCGNFEYFDAHPDGTDGMGGRSLSQRLFEVRLDILHELQRIEYQEQEFARSYYNKTKDLLHAAVYRIKGHSARMQVRAEMQYVDKYSDYATWESVSPLMVKEIKVHITPLLDSGLEGFDLSIAFDIRMLDIELSMLVQGNTGMATRDVKTVRQVAQYLLTEKASIPQVFAKAEQLKTLVSEQFWDAPSLEKLEQLRVDVRDLMQFLDKSPKKQIDVNIDDTVEPSGYDGGDTIIDIRTYREKVLDYLIEHSDNEVIHKIQRLEPITNEDLKALEKILWEELGTKEEYEQTTDIDNLAVFVRSLIGLSQEAVNEKFGEYLNGNVLNAQQQEFIRAIINYVRENGDISREDLIEKSPFDNYDILTLFGDNITSVLTIVGILHDSVNVAA